MSKSFKETLKFLARMTLFALPLVIDQLTQAGLTEWAAFASAVLALVDKYIHESDLKINGLTKF